MNTTDNQVKDIHEIIRDLRLSEVGIQGQIDSLKINANTPAMVVLPLYESLSRTELRRDSIIATREEMKRSVRRLRSEITETEKQLMIVHGLIGKS